MGMGKKRRTGGYVRDEIGHADAYRRQSRRLAASAIRYVEQAPSGAGQ